MNTSLKYIKSCLFLMILTLLLSTIGGLGIIHFRQAIADSAQILQDNEVKIAAMQRSIRELDSQIARLHRPAYLIRRIGRMGLEMSPPQPWQIVRLDPGRQTEGDFPGLLTLNEVEAKEDMVPLNLNFRP